MTDFAWRGHGVSVAAGIWARTARHGVAARSPVWVAGRRRRPYNAKFYSGTYKEKDHVLRARSHARAARRRFIANRPSGTLRACLPRSAPTRAQRA